MSETEFYGLIHPDDRQRMAAHMESLLHGNDTELEIEYRFKTKDDRWIWCLSRDSVFIRSPSGAVAQIIGTFLDVTARRQAEQALRDSETKMRSIFRAAPIGIGVVSNRIFREVNERLCRNTFNISREFTLGSTSCTGSTFRVGVIFPMMSKRLFIVLFKKL
jgi:PAS domain-containing protein